jgi:hypothetical protein
VDWNPQLFTSFFEKTNFIKQLYITKSIREAKQEQSGTNTKGLVGAPTTTKYM